MELRQLRYFLAVAEDLHFTHAAQRMHVAQPALSAQIRALEREVGGALLDRSTRNVQLTDAGRVLARDAAKMIEASDRALAEVRSVARRSSHTLAIGCMGAPVELLEEALDTLALEQPEAVIDLRTFDYVQLWPALTGGDIDLAVTYLPPGTTMKDLDILPLMEEPRFVVLSRTHELAGRSELRPSDLETEVFITHPDEVPQDWRDFWLLTEQLGRRPPVHPVKADTIEKWLHLISRCEGLDTCPSYVARYYAWPTVRYVPLRDAPPVTLAAVRSKRLKSPLAEDFLEAAVAAAAAHKTV